ncbi:MAG: hypothetical protein AAF802_10325 [Planctomycetota bacterium]
MKQRPTTFMQQATNFTQFTRRLMRAGKSGDDAAMKIFRDEQPGVVAQLKRDVRRRGPLPFWGKSLNHDEFAGKVIVPPLVIRLLSKLTGRSISERTPHAGLQHCYGYLFSNLKTRFGFKRERWIENGLEDAFGLEASTLSPKPGSGTLLANATFFCGRVAYRGRPLTNSLFESLAKRVSPDLLDLSFRSITHLRLSETVRRIWRKKIYRWTLQTDVIQAENGFAVLAYSIRSEKRHELVTLFPVDQETVSAIRERGSISGKTECRTRYNAYIPALHGESHEGRISFREF